RGGEKIAFLNVRGKVIVHSAPVDTGKDALSGPQPLDREQKASPYRCAARPERGFDQADTIGRQADRKIGRVGRIQGGCCSEKRSSQRRGKSSIASSFSPDELDVRSRLF